MGKEFKGNERLGIEKLNNQCCPMKIIEYNNALDIVVEFQDEYKAKVHTSWDWFNKGVVKNPFAKLDEERLNNQNCPMRIVGYIDANNIIVEFQDKYKARVHTGYGNFKKGNVKNPYYTSVYGVGMVGKKYPAKINGEHTKEYKAWSAMLNRCYGKSYEHSTYQDVTCCEEWLLYDNFYEWLHSQLNFDKWFNEERWAIDKDILNKGNKIYSPKTCCLVPMNINSLFTNRSNRRGNLPIGVGINKKTNKYVAVCNSPFTNKGEHLGTYDTIEEAFRTYKQYKENIIKQVAQIEYDKNNIIKQCYEAMLNYKVEITD